MKIFFLFWIISISVFASNTFFTTDPSLSPDGSKILFSYEEDIWIVSSSGGQAYRVTGMEGRESEPVYSPDGKWIAFTGRQDGNPNIYFMPSDGGEIVRLTFHDEADYVESWSWDSKFIYFSSNRYNYRTAFKVSIEGGTPERLFDHYFNWPHNIVEDPNEDIVYFNTSWESYRFPMRKRYVGAFNSDIQSYNFETGEYKKLTRFEGKDLWPSVDKNGTLYFASVEFNNEYNLYKFENGNKLKLTEFERSIKKPRVSADGSKVVFEKDYQIYVYDAESKNSSLVDISLFANNTLSFKKEFDTAGKIAAFDVSPDNKKIAFVSRGQLFVSDIEGKFINQLKTDNTERVIDVKWLKDNETILFLQTVDGWTNLFKTSAGKNSDPEQLTEDEQNNKGLTLNSERTKGVYHSGRNELRIIDLITFESKTIVEDEFWAVYATPAYFSPDNKYIVYSAYRNFEEDIFIYNIEEEKSAHLTKTGVNETNPFWSPDGKYIYFTTDRYSPTYPSGFKDSEIYRIALNNYDDDYRSDEYETLFIEEEKDTTKPAVTIDYNNLKERWEPVAEQPQNQFGTYVIQEEKQTFVFYTSNHDNDGWNLWTTVITPFKKTETKKIEGAEGNSFTITGAAGGKYYVQMGSDIFKLDLASYKVEKITVSKKFTRDLKSEFNQMFYEAWANIDENFYDGDFHGIDWKKTRDYYAKFLPYIKNRDNLRTIFSDMLGELNSSHLGFYSSGEEEKTYYEYTSANTGIMFDEKNPFIVKRIVDQSPAYKGNKDIRTGDNLVAVNGTEVDSKLNRESYFDGPSLNEEIELTFDRNGERHSLKIKPVNSGELETLLYDEWMSSNQKRVDTASKERIAYIHMKNMTNTELLRFKKEIADEWHYRDALILDLRYNRGGNVHDEVLQTLSQKAYLQWKYRGGEFTPQPNFAVSDKPIMLLVNEQSLSDAEMTAEGFQTLQLGKIIGNETYRWIIFTTNVSLVDGTTYRLPSWGCYTLEGENIEKVGVTPDILVINTFSDRLEGKDPQLDKAVEVIMKELK